MTCGTTGATRTPCAAPDRRGLDCLFVALCCLSLFLMMCMVCESLPACCLPNHACSGGSPACSAASGHDMDMLSLLVSAGADLNSPDVNLWRPIHCAARAGNVPAMQLLLSAGADPGTSTCSGHTAFGVALMFGQPAFALELLRSTKGRVGKNEFSVMEPPCGAAEAYIMRNFMSFLQFSYL